MSSHLVQNVKEKSEEETGESEEALTEENESEVTEKATATDELPRCDRMCLHKDDRICYHDMGDKNIIKKIPQENGDGTTYSSSSESIDSDSLHSGESLFKTFTFDTQDNQDVEKCMSFWNSILKKNIKPVKCTILKKKITENKEKPVKEEEKQTTSKDSDLSKMWMDIYKDLQRRKLDQVKLIRRKECDPCGEYSEDEEDKIKEKEDIKKLNEWTSKSKITTKKSNKTNVRLPKQTLKQKTTDVKIIVEKTDLEDKLPVKESIKPTDDAIISNKDTPVIKSKNDESKTCTCGCGIEGCTCESVYVKNNIEVIKNEPLNCEPCECQNECACNITHKTEIACDCGVEGCICDNFKECTSKSVRAENSIKTNGCSCGCGLEECICEQLFTKSCKCGHSDCTCDIIEIISTYMESLTTPVTSHRQHDHMVTEETQVEDPKLLSTMEVTQAEDSYCVICGHFNCFCKIKK